MSEENKVDLSEFYAQKAGMTRIFDESGKHVPVTVVKLIPNVISRVKTQDKDGYTAYQIAFKEKRAKLVSKPIQGQLKKSNVSQMMTRFSEVKHSKPSEDHLGKEISLTGFAAKTMVDVTGTSKGKGFAGVIKRHNFGGAPASHGHKWHRHGGSIGQCATPARVYKEKKMPGHMGVKTKTVQNLEVVELNEEQGYMLIKGSIPGSKNGFVKIARALKANK
jgi:large subunit ribosomal protein L3